MGDPPRAGWLEKRGGVNTQFRRRWFTLDTRAGEFAYRRQPSDPVAAGAIPLRGASVHLLACDAKGFAGMEIAAPERTRVFVLRGPAADLQAWAADLEAAAAALAELFPPAADPPPDAAEPGDPAVVYKTGWLEKQGHVVPGWRRRWFVLRYGRLEYFRHPTDAMPRGCALLPEGCSRIVPAAGAAAGASGDALLEVRSVMDGRVYTLRSVPGAEAAAGDLVAWLAALTLRHADPRANWLLRAVPYAAAPAAAAVILRRPGAPAAVDLNNGRASVVDPRALRPLYSPLSEAVRRLAAGPRLCRLFCGGAACKHCDAARWLGDGTAVRGVHATWVTHDRLAMSRPVQAAVLAHAIPSALAAAGVAALFNVQQPGEHAHCGPPLVASGGFSYDPAAFRAHGIAVECCGWDDYGTPDPAQLLAAVIRMQAVLDRGAKIAVHCHAGLGRTGVLLAASVVFGLRYAGDEAVALLRQRRPGCLQTAEQVQAVLDFAAALAVARTALPPAPVPLATLLARHAALTLPPAAPVVPRYLQTLMVAAAGAACVSAPAADVARVGAALNCGLWDELAEGASPAAAFATLCQWLRLLSVPLARDTATPGAAALQAALGAWAASRLGPPARRALAAAMLHEVEGAGDDEDADGSLALARLTVPLPPTT